MTDAITTRWWWVRHAPVPGPRDLIKGKLDLSSDVSDTQSFTALAARLPRGAATVTSSRVRTQQTFAALVAAGFAAKPPAIEPAIDEQDFGTLAGNTWGDLRGVPELDAFWADPANVALPGGESFAALVERVRPAIARIGARHLGEDIVAVAHGGTIRAALAIALGISPAAALTFAVETLSLTRIDAIGPAWRVMGVDWPPYF